MTRYASQTSVSVEKSQAEIQQLLRRHGADQFVQSWSKDGAQVGFVIDNLGVQIALSLPDSNDEEFSKTPAGRRRRSSEDRMRAWEQACRVQWRALVLVVKAKLEAVAAGISTIQEEFLSWVVVPGDGRTIGQVLEPRMMEIAAGKPTALALPAPRRRK